MNWTSMLIAATMLTNLWMSEAASAASGTANPAQEPASLPAGILVEVTRGPLVESRHYGRLVAVTPEGDVRLAVGDPHELVLSRSTLKPLQALATVQLALERGLELTTEEIAILCASHEARDYHLQAVKRLLDRAGATEQQLHCGSAEASRLGHNCSGKHGGMLVQARLAGDSLDGYWEPQHAVQRRIQIAIQEFTGYDGPLQWGVDGCGVPNYALPLYHLALGYARLANPETAPASYRAAAAAIRQAILEYPGHVSSRGSFHARLLEAGGQRLIGKGGAEACYGLGLTGDRSGSHAALGVAVKIDDGGARGMPQVLLAALERLGALTRELETAMEAERTQAITNSRGEAVGEIRAAAW